MKKIITVLGALLFSAGVFASSGFGDLSKNLKALDVTKVETITASIPGGKELFPIVYRYVKGEHTLGEKVLGVTIVLEKANVIDNEYQIHTHLYFKQGIGIQCQESVISVTGDGTYFTVATEKYVSYGVNSNRERTTDVMEMQKKAVNSCTKQFVDNLNMFFDQITDQDYDLWADKAYSDFEIQLNLGNYAANRLKAKKWYEKHPLTGKSVDIPFWFTNIKESKVEGFDYELSGLAGKSSTVLLKVLSNNDKYIDTQDDSVLRIKGKVREVSYSGEYSQDYKIIQVVIEEE